MSVAPLGNPGTGGVVKAEITRDVKKGLTGSVFFILALVVLFYSTASRGSR